jgi:hypothetical protein
MIFIHPVDPVDPVKKKEILILSSYVSSFAGELGESPQTVYAAMGRWCRKNISMLVVSAAHFCSIKEVYSLARSAGI